ncbi:MAG: DUF2493 domain-containing protein [Azospirillum sp.]|nr:DUF2493 domain-containing protein [Azospirillum sp.]
MARPTPDPGFPTRSATAALLEELALYGVRPHDDEPDHRPLPDAETCDAALSDLFDLLAQLFEGTRLEDDLEPVLWGLVNLFHRRIDHLHRTLDDNESAQARSQREQDGSEVKSVELERLIAQGLTLIERRNAFEAFRDRAAELFEVRTGSSWRPHAGSLVSRRTLTAAMIDSRDFVAARRRAETQVHLPPGPRIAFAGGVDYQNVERIWAALDKVHAKHPDMVLLHGGSRGAELIAAKWAEHRTVVQVVFKPDWNRHSQAAPFKRNDQMLDAQPIGLIAAPGSGVTDNLVDKARRQGIPVFRIDGGGA